MSREAGRERDRETGRGEEGKITGEKKKQERDREIKIMRERG